jgi:hypothetical protein
MQEPLSENMREYLNSAGYDLRPYNSRHGAVPDDCRVLIVTTPERDLEEFEARHLSDYLRNNGRILFLVGSNRHFPNLNSVMEEYGLFVGTAQILEGDARHYTMNSPDMIVPVMAGHEINLRVDARENSLVLPGMFPVMRTDTAHLKADLTLANMLTTTRSAIGKTGNITSFERMPGDLEGPFNLAVSALHDTFYRGTAFQTRLIVLGSDLITNDAMMRHLNKSYVVLCLNWLIDRSDRDSVYIPPRAFGASPVVNINQQQATTIKVFVWGVLPALILGTGVFVWLRRRTA